MLLILAAGCSEDEPEAPTAATPTATAGAPTPTAESGATRPARSLSFITVVIDAPSRFEDFAGIDEFGNVVGFEADIMADLAAATGFDYEFVVTSFSGLLDSVASGEFDAAMSALLIPETPPAGLAYTIPYLEVGQVLVVRANERVLQSYSDIQPGIPIGVQQYTYGEQTAHETVGLAEPDLRLYETTPAALQALIDGEVEGVIIDSDDAGHFTTTYPQQLKIAGGAGQEAWISRQAYGIAVAADNEPLLNLLNEAIGQAAADGTVERLARAWLIPQETINAGESLVGTPANELVIGVAGLPASLDPASPTPDQVSWEIHVNTMSGLLTVDASNNLVPLLATDFPEISEDKLEYTFALRPGLTFPDDSELTAEDVKFSMDRAAGLGNFTINSILKDADDNHFADDDAVQIIDPLTVKFVLGAPTADFLYLLATPPFFILSSACDPANFDPTSSCSGLGPYRIIQWEPGIQVRLKANPSWPGTAPAFENIQVRFYEDAGRMRRSLENNAIDMAWTGLPLGDRLALRDTPGFVYWEGPSVFKSYLVFEQSEPPWDNERLRQAIAYAVDREALASQVFEGTRRPLFSPVPNDTLGHVDTEPARNLDQARALLTAAGYTEAQKLAMTLWYVNDGRYTPLEEAYAQALAAQLEETGLIEVTLQGAPWDVFRPQSLTCNYPAYLLGWPSSGQPPGSLDGLSWLEYFITSTDRVCSNYESEAMTELLERALAETNETARLELYRQIQSLWAQEFPTLDLTQEPRVAVSLPTVQNVVIDAMGFMRYELLTKGG
ncbi:MAG: ABC transporter substrate-binding protein [Chloroflexi bacterium]|nr:ABC transporter substrate-binding protein [Chloroflexota bacterium]MCI0576738.1 ABC transporter substrate-binding protein [Chloroflexota bacterium]MCI0646000.1 ABC transporter substrate-binding protein [Chloroflexota bacterium]MCI0726851.1 ABC transporter substrate-binding protein [Chloroflexota bacterium]